MERHCATQSQGHGRARAGSPHASSTAWKCDEPLGLNPACLSKVLHGNPGNFPRSNLCLLPLPQQHRLGKGGLPSGLCSPAEPPAPSQPRPKEPGDPAHQSSGQSATNCTFSSLKFCWDKCFRVPISGTSVPWRLSACGWDVWRQGPTPLHKVTKVTKDSTGICTQHPCRNGCGNCTHHRLWAGGDLSLPNLPPRDTAACPSGHSICQSSPL